MILDRKKVEANTITERMNAMIEKIIDEVSKTFPLKELEVGQMSSLKAKGMNFTIRAYHAEGLGHVSVMSAKGFFGLMKMDTVIINPTEKDLPLYSYDRIYAMGNDTLIVELYDTLLGNCDLSQMQKIKEKYKELPLRDPGEHWYDNIKLDESISVKAKSKQSEIFDNYAMEHLKAYLSVETEMQNVDEDEKRKKASVYVEGLLKNGGPSTDVFKKELGEEKTGELFRKVLFGTK